MYYENFEKLCELNKVRPSTVSRATGISTATLTSWKQGKYTPKQDKLQLIADYFNVSVDYLLTGEEKENKMPIFEYSSDIMELIKLYSQLNKGQKSAILNMMRSFALTNQ